MRNVTAMLEQPTIAGRHLIHDGIAAAAALALAVAIAIVLWAQPVERKPDGYFYRAQVLRAPTPSPRDARDRPPRPAPQRHPAATR